MKLAEIIHTTPTMKKVMMKAAAGGQILEKNMTRVVKKKETVKKMRIQQMKMKSNSLLTCHAGSVTKCLQPEAQGHAMKNTLTSSRRVSGVGILVELVVERCSQLRHH